MEQCCNEEESEDSKDDEKREHWFASRDTVLELAVAEEDEKDRRWSFLKSVFVLSFRCRVNEIGEWSLTSSKSSSPFE